MPITITRPARSLVDPVLFARLTARVMHEEHVTRRLSERIVDQTLAFLAACAANHKDPLSPSPLVDVGWHTFILYTREYAEFCQRVAGRFLHHVPTDDEQRVDPGQLRDQTVTAITAAGYEVDADLWDLAGKCTQCYNGCADSPRK